MTGQDGPAWGKIAARSRTPIMRMRPAVGLAFPDARVPRGPLPWRRLLSSLSVAMVSAVGMATALLGLGLLAEPGRAEPIGETAARSSALAEFSLGVRAGTVFAQHTGTEERDSQYAVQAGWRTGFMAGVLLFWPVTERFGLQQEFLYVQKGSRQDIAVDILDVPAQLDVRYEMDYFELPILLRFAWLRWPAREVYSIVGTALSLKLRDRYVLSGEVDDGVEVVPLRADADMAEVDMFDYSFVYGLGVEVDAAARRLLIEYRFVSGWNSLAMPTYAYVPFGEEEVLIENDPVPLKNQTHSISVGIRF